MKLSSLIEKLQEIAKKDKDFNNNPSIFSLTERRGTLTVELVDGIKRTDFGRKATSKSREYIIKLNGTSVW